MAEKAPKMHVVIVEQSPESPQDEQGMTFEEYIAQRPEAPQAVESAGNAKERYELQREWARYDEVMNETATTPEAHTRKAYEDLGMKELIQLARDARLAGDKGVMLDAEGHIEQRLHTAIENGIISEEAGERHLNFILKNIYEDKDGVKKGTDTEQSPHETSESTEKGAEVAKDERYDTLGTKDLIQLARDARLAGDKEAMLAAEWHLENRLYHNIEREVITEEAGERDLDAIIEGIYGDEEKETTEEAALETEPKEAKTISEEASDSAPDETEKDKATGEAKNTPAIELPPEIMAALGEARSSYAAAVAKERNATWKRLAMSDSALTNRLLRKIPGMSKLFDTINNKTSAKQFELRDEYEAAVEVAIADLETQLEQAGYSEMVRNSTVVRTLLDNDFLLEAGIRDARMEQSKPTNKFVNWWVNQKGVSGKLKKAGIVVGTGVAIGLTGGLAVGTVAAGSYAFAAAGAGAGAAIANHVTKRRANAEVRLGDGRTMAMADMQAKQDIEAKQSAIQQGEYRDAETGEVNYALVNEQTEQRTNDEVLGNRRRMKIASALGATAAGLGFNGGAMLREQVGSFMTDTPAQEVKASVQPPAETTPTPEAEPVQALEGQNFTVEYGSGYTNELTQFAQANGQNLSPEQSVELHNYLVDTFGQDYINIDAAPTDTYMYGSDVRLSNPGGASWENGVPEAIQEWMQSRGLWHS
ncbi:MAG: hypothetical protein Q4B06_01160 [Candidatus Saccharibacteria bacterium]|nr:hypothetical protein [Candidatus Saccharibacteria bacterium]